MGNYIARALIDNYNFNYELKKKNLESKKTRIQRFYSYDDILNNSNTNINTFTNGNKKIVSQ